MSRAAPKAWYSILRRAPKTHVVEESRKSRAALKAHHVAELGDVPGGRGGESRVALKARVT